ncbi:MAG: hypothetical protein HN715_00540 [Rhodobiaceae bacterium]|jgi:hypothetical protein|nr:hypothetical protein [Rhodobiaceae bacterium]
MSHRVTIAILSWVCLALATPVSSQDLGIPSAIIGGANDVNIDRFGKPVFGFRAQREPDLRRLRAQAGRKVLQGRVEIYDVDMEDLEAALSRNTKLRKNTPKITCAQQREEIVCQAQ